MDQFPPRPRSRRWSFETRLLFGALLVALPALLTLSVLLMRAPLRP